MSRNKLIKWSCSIFNLHNKGSLRLRHAVDTLSFFDGYNIIFMTSSLSVRESSDWTLYSVFLRWGLFKLQVCIAIPSFYFFKQKIDLEHLWELGQKFSVLHKYTVLCEVAALITLTSGGLVLWLITSSCLKQWLSGHPHCLKQNCKSWEQQQGQGQLSDQDLLRCEITFLGSPEFKTPQKLLPFQRD